MTHIETLVENISRETKIDKKLVAEILREGVFLGRDADYDKSYEISKELRNMIYN